MKVLVFMSDNRYLENDIEKANYNSLVAVINNEYCKKHNYDFLYFIPTLNGSNALYNCVDPNSGELRHASWSKLLSTKICLEKEYDYIVYIDSDCIFKDFNFKIEGIIDDSDIIFLNNKPWGDELPCAGFYICKVCDRTKTMIKEWYNYRIPEKNINNNWEQDALWNIYKNYNIKIIDSWMFKEDNKQFLRHICHIENNIRIGYFRNFIRSNNINYNINDIKSITFNTLLV